MFAFVSLITSFLTSVWGAHRMLAGGAVEAAKSLTSRSILRRILAEGSLYMSMFFFLVSLRSYIWMVYSGPDICPTYRGLASFCARQGADLYAASAPFCKPRCSQLDLNGENRNCRPQESMWDCLCKEVCGYRWDLPYNWSMHTSIPNPGVYVHNYHFFAYRPMMPISKAAREKVMAASSSLMCNHEKLESKKDSCFEADADDCTTLFLAWQKSEECMEDSIQDAQACSKVCSWDAGYPPREALRRTTDFTFIPLGVMLIFLTLSRIIIIILRALSVFSHEHSVVTRWLMNVCCVQARGEDNEDDEEEGSNSDNEQQPLHKT